jgi:hypothetical protein
MLIQVACFVLLVCLVVLSLVILLEVRRKSNPIFSATYSPVQQASSSQTNDVELLVRTPDGWRHHSFRPADHQDVQEALNTPGLAIRRDGKIEVGTE